MNKTRLKKTCIGLLMALVAALVLFGTVGSTVTVRAGGSENEGKVYAANTWRTKYYMKLFYKCSALTLDKHYYADVITIGSAWSGSWAPDHDYNDDIYHNPKLLSDPLIGAGSRCSTIPSLIANTYDYINKVNGNKKTWSSASKDEKAGFLTDLGFRAWVDTAGSGGKLYECNGCSEIERMEKAYTKGQNDEDYVIALYKNTEASAFKQKLLNMAGLSEGLSLAEYYWRDYNGVLESCDVGNGFKTERPTVNADQRVIEFPEVVENVNGFKLEKRYIITEGRSGGATRNYHFYDLNNFNDDKDHYVPCIGDDALKKEYYESGYDSNGQVKVASKDLDINAEAAAALKEMARSAGFASNCASSYETDFYNTIKESPNDLTKKINEQKEDYSAKVPQTLILPNQADAMNYNMSLTNGGYGATAQTKYNADSSYVKVAKKEIADLNLADFGFSNLQSYGSCTQGYVGTNTSEEDVNYICKSYMFKQYASGEQTMSNYENKKTKVNNILNNITIIDNFTQYQHNVADYEDRKSKATKYIENNIPSASLVKQFAKAFEATGRLSIGSEPNDIATNLNSFSNPQVQRVLVANFRKDGTASFTCNITAFEEEKKELEKITGETISLPSTYYNYTFQSGLDDPNNIAQNDYGSGSSVPTCEGTAVMGWVLCKVTQIATDGARWLYENAVAQSLQLDAGELAANNEGAHQAWSYFVSFANIILVILFLFVIFSQLTGFGIDNYGIKRVLPKLIIVAILINLSFIICQLAVDATNILGHSFESLFDGITVSQNTSVDKTNVLDATLSGLFAAAGLTLGGIGVAFIVKERKSLLTGLLLPILLVVLVAFIAVLFFFILLGVRKAGILALVVVSPVAIVCYALPNTKKYFDKWKNGLKSLLIVYPICGLMLGMSRFVARLVTAGGSDFISSLVATAVLAYPFFVIPTLISRSISAVTSLGDKISQLGRGLRRKTSDGVKNTAAYQQAQKRREEAKAQRMNRRMRDMTEGKGIGGKLFGGQYKKQADKQKALNDRIAAIQAAAAKDKRAVTAEEQAEIDSIKEEKRKNAERWIARGGLSVEEAAARAKAEDDKIKARVDFEQQSEKGSTTEAVINLAGIQATNAAYMDLARATEPPKKIDFATATQRADSAHQSEEYKGFSEQFGQLDKGGLKNAAINALRKLSVENGGDTNEAQAAIDLLKKGGFTQETLEAFDEALGGDALKNDTKRQSLISILGSSGNILMKGYSKYLAEAGADAVSFKQWMQNGDSNLVTNALANMKLEDYGGDVEAFNKAKHDRRQKLETLTSLKAYKEATFTNDDMLANADKDTIKFLNAKAQKEELGGAITKADLARASVSKSGEELTAVNKGIETSLNNVKIEGTDGMTIKRTFTYDANGNVTGTLYAQYDKTGAKVTDVDEAAYLDAFKNSVAEFGFSNESFGKLEKSTWNALTNGNTALKEAFGEQYGDQIMAVRKDKRIWNKISKEMQDELIKSLPEKMKQELENWEKTQRGASQDSDQNQDQN